MLRLAVAIDLLDSYTHIDQSTLPHRPDQFRHYLEWESEKISGFSETAKTLATLITKWRVNCLLNA